MNISRRLALKGLAASTVMAGLPGLAFARANTDNRLIVVFLRGGVDGLTIAPAYGDANFRAVRRDLADDDPGSGGPFEMLDLDGFFALNPDLKHVHAMYGAGEALVLHCTTTGYRERSHFDAQDALDRGSVSKAVGSGWLNRALGVIPAEFADAREAVALGLGPTLPLSLRGPRKVTNWSPPSQYGISEGTLSRLDELYMLDPELGPTLAKARTASMMAGEGMGRTGNTGQFETLTGAAAQFLSKPDGPRIATIDYGNWDSHSGQNDRNVPGPENAYYAGRFPEMYLAFDRGMQALKTGLGDSWAQTTVLVVTEFGRTVHVNGTGGTDHGTAGAAFLLGGNVNGGRVIADWRGLAPKDLYEERDLYPTADTRSMMKSILYSQFGVGEGVLEDEIFPDSRSAAPLSGLFKA